MNKPIYLGPVIANVHIIGDCYEVACVIRAHLVHAAQYVLLDPSGRVYIQPGYVQLPVQAQSWLLGAYNRNASSYDIANDLTSELRERRDAMMQARDVRLDRRGARWAG